MLGVIKRKQGGAKWGYLDDALLVDETVGRLEIAVQTVAVVEVLHPPRNVDRRTVPSVPPAVRIVT